MVHTLVYAMCMYATQHTPLGSEACDSAVHILRTVDHRKRRACGHSTATSHENSGTANVAQGCII